MSSKVIAVLCSDIHLCHTCPPARSAEPNWYDAMGRVLDQLQSIAHEHQVPILCAGDVFDKWNSLPELINFAIGRLPEMIAIPGQHDLPHHALEEIERSAFWTLVAAEVVRTNCEAGIISNYGMNISLFPWGIDIAPQNKDSNHSKKINVALRHKFVWKRGKGYPGALEESLASNIPNLDNYDVAVFGDNHQAFDCAYKPQSKTVVVNPGCLIPRKQDERYFKPTVYLLMDDGSVELHHLDTSEDKWTDDDVFDAEVELAGMECFLSELRNLDADSLDFEQAVKQYCDTYEISEQTKSLLFDSME